MSGEDYHLHNNLHCTLSITKCSINFIDYLNRTQNSTEYRGRNSTTQAALFNSPNTWAWNLTRLSSSERHQEFLFQWMKQNDHHWHLSAFNTEHKRHIELELRIWQCIYEASMIKSCGYVDRPEFSTQTIMDMVTSENLSS